MVWRNVTGTQRTSVGLTGEPANSALTGVVSGRVLAAPRADVKRRLCDLAP